ncbi:MAG: glycosyltransferase family 4 protein [Thermoleophilaceae bacterium]|nr:glycosyltransferase family 4 protein [Thermoleophilaceae bacterium]
MTDERRPPRVLLLIYALHDAGGAELQLKHLAIGLARRGYEVTLACMDRLYADPAPFEEAGVRPISLERGGRLERMLAIPLLVRLAREADLVHCTMWDASLWGRLAGIVARRPVIVADHATDRSVQTARDGSSRRHAIALHYRLLDRFTYATVACASTQLELLESEGVRRERIAFIRNGVPVAALRAQAEASSLRRSDIGLPDDALVVMQVGVFRPEKNQLATLEVVRRLREELGDVHAVFVGTGKLQGEVERRARELGADWAHFLGLRSDVAPLLSLADLAVLPSLSDAMPMTLLEAMALGVPVVGTDVGDMGRVLRETGAGLVVPPADEAALAAACRAVLSDEPLRRRLAEAAGAARPTLDSAAMVDRYSALIDGALAGIPAARVIGGWRAPEAAAPEKAGTAA